MTNFKNLVEASKIIEEITENAKIMHEDFMTSNCNGVIEQVVKYMTEFCKPLYDTDIKFSVSYGGIKFSKEKDYCKLYKNIPMSGYADTFEIMFTKYTTITNRIVPNQMIVEIAQYWRGFKEHLIEVTETEIKNKNREKQYQIEKMIKEQELIKNFII